MAAYSQHTVLSRFHDRREDTCHQRLNHVCTAQLFRLAYRRAARDIYQQNCSTILRRRLRLPAQYHKHPIDAFPLQRSKLASAVLELQSFSSSFRGGRCGWMMQCARSKSVLPLAVFRAAKMTEIVPLTSSAAVFTVDRAWALCHLRRLRGRGLPYLQSDFIFTVRTLDEVASATANVANLPPSSHFDITANVANLACAVAADLQHRLHVPAQYLRTFALLAHVRHLRSFKQPRQHRHHMSDMTPALLVIFFPLKLFTLRFPVVTVFLVSGPAAFPSFESTKHIPDKEHDHYDQYFHFRTPNQSQLRNPDQSPYL